MVPAHHGLRLDQEQVASRVPARRQAAAARAPSLAAITSRVDSAVWPLPRSKDRSGLRPMSAWFLTNISQPSARVRAKVPALAGLSQIDRSIDEAATSLGASALRGFADVLFPMLRGALTTGFVTAFVRAVTTLSVVIFLFTPGSTVANITIFQLVDDFNWGGATASTVADIGLAVLVLTVGWLVTGRRTLMRAAAGA